MNPVCNDESADMRDINEQVIKTYDLNLKSNVNHAYPNSSTDKNVRSVSCHL
jgi:hypothetical protein